MQHQSRVSLVRLKPCFWVLSKSTFLFCYWVRHTPIYWKRDNNCWMVRLGLQYIQCICPCFFSWMTYSGSLSLPIVSTIWVVPMQESSKDLLVASSCSDLLLWSFGFGLCILAMASPLTTGSVVVEGEEEFCKVALATLVGKALFLGKGGGVA